MPEKNKSILEQANAAIAEGNHEGFLSFCTDDTEWTFIGERTLKGKDAVRQWMATTYIEPPKFMVARLIAEDDFVVALGEITVKGRDGREINHSYCDIWRFRGDKMFQLKAFVVAAELKKDVGSD